MQFFSISQKYRIFTFRTFKCPIGESQHLRKEIIHRINQLGKEGKPFLFVIRQSGQPSFHRATKRAFLLDQGAITKKDLTPDDLMKADYNNFRKKDASTPQNS